MDSGSGQRDGLRASPSLSVPVGCWLAVEGGGGLTGWESSSTGGCEGCCCVGFEDEVEIWSGAAMVVVVVVVGGGDYCRGGGLLSCVDGDERPGSGFRLDLSVGLFGVCLFL